MRNKITLNDYNEHPSKAIIDDFGIRQYDLAYTLGIGQSRLSQMLRGIRPMPTKIESEIKAILESLKPEPKPKKPEPKPEPKKRKKPEPKPEPEKKRKPKKRIIKPKKA